uniref:Uncharacterized protein n=1 Tax=Arundo donax TaxID=35708 RepID=A0A0A8Z083_ARUDO
MPPGRMLSPKRIAIARLGARTGFSPEEPHSGEDTSTTPPRGRMTHVNIVVIGTGKAGQALHPESSLPAHDLPLLACRQKWPPSHLAAPSAQPPPSQLTSAVMTCTLRAYTVTTNGTTPASRRRHPKRSTRCRRTAAASVRCLLRPPREPPRRPGLRTADQAAAPPYGPQATTAAAAPPPADFGTPTKAAPPCHPATPPTALPLLPRACASSTAAARRLVLSPTEQISGEPQPTRSSHLQSRRHHSLHRGCHRPDVVPARGAVRCYARRARHRGAPGADHDVHIDARAHDEIHPGERRRTTGPSYGRLLQIRPRGGVTAPPPPSLRLTRLPAELSSGGEARWVRGEGVVAARLGFARAAPLGAMRAMGSRTR